MCHAVKNAVIIERTSLRCGLRFHQWLCVNVGLTTFISLIPVSNKSEDLQRGFVFSKEGTVKTGSDIVSVFLLQELKKAIYSEILLPGFETETCGIRSIATVGEI